MHQTTAILLFSRTAREEALLKPFSRRGRVANEQIAGQFIAHAEKTARQTGLPVVLVSSEAQQGNTFGERLANAFRLVFAKGYQRVLAIGNDCPYLTARLLKEAAARLQTEQMVVGPARDGGAYLIGLSECSFRGNDFQHLAWQTPDFYQSLLNYSRTYGLSYAELSPSYDLDTGRDVAAFLNSQHRLPSLRKLAQITGNLLKEVQEPLAGNITFRPDLFAAAVLSRRGPPARL